MAALYTAFDIKNENVSIKLTHSKFCFFSTTFAHTVEEAEQCLPVSVQGTAQPTVVSGYDPLQAAQVLLF